MDFRLFAAGAIVAAVIVGLVLALASRRYPDARPWARLAAISIAALPVGVLVHNVVGALTGGEEATSFVVALVIAPAGFAIGTVGAGLAVARRRSEVGASLLVAGAGMALLGLYAVFALVVTAIERGNPPYQASIEAVVLPVSLLALTGGALSAMFWTVGPLNAAER